MKNELIPGVFYFINCLDNLDKSLVRCIQPTIYYKKKIYIKKCTRK